MVKVTLETSNIENCSDRMKEDIMKLVLETGENFNNYGINFEAKVKW